VYIYIDEHMQGIMILPLKNILQTMSLVLIDYMLINTHEEVILSEFIGTNRTVTYQY